MTALTVLNASHWLPGGSPQAFADWFRAPAARREKMRPYNLAEWNRGYGIVYGHVWGTR